jgi:hypothetical protein
MNAHNLVSFKKGQSGNPNGRPKGSKNRSTLVRELLEMVSTFDNPLTEQSEKFSYVEQIIIAQIAEARKGNVQAFKELMDSAYGKIKDVHQFEEPEKETEFVVTIVNAPQPK